jgi:tetraacyldisaccharide 4'-kinase
VTRLEAVWWGGAPAGWPLRASLAAGELVFRAGAAARASLYQVGVLRAAHAPAPVLSVGNLAVGGAGKTPAALALAARLAARGRRVALLSRGYGAFRRDARVVSDGRRLLLGASEAGDEPALLARRLPGAAVLCGPRRAALARLAVEALGADALVLDDGFQHRALARDLDLVVLDAVDPAGNGRLLPRGPNREPLAALQRAHLAWLSRADEAEPAALDSLRARARAATARPPVEARYAVSDVLDGALAASRGRDALRGRRVLLLCALARPDGFRRTLARLGAEVVAERVFRDHHAFTSAELREVLAAADRARAAWVATTEKDAVRLPPEVARDPHLAVVRIDAEITAGADVLDGLVDEVLARWPSSGAIGGPTIPLPRASGGGMGRGQEP